MRFLDEVFIRLTVGKTASACGYPNSVRMMCRLLAKFA